MLYSRGSDFPHNGGYLRLISFVPLKSHWIYLALCAAVIMWARRSCRSFEHSPPPPSSLSPSPSSSVIGFLTIPPVFLSSPAPEETPAFNLSWGNLTVEDWSSKIKTIDPPCAKTHSFTRLLTPSFLCQAADTNWHSGGCGGGSGEEEEEEVRAVSVLRFDGSVQVCLTWAAAAEIWAPTVNEVLGTSDDLRHRRRGTPRPESGGQRTEAREWRPESFPQTEMAEVQIWVKEAEKNIDLKFKLHLQNKKNVTKQKFCYGGNLPLKAH